MQLLVYILISHGIASVCHKIAVGTVLSRSFEGYRGRLPPEHSELYEIRMGKGPVREWNFVDPKELWRKRVGYFCGELDPLK
jgi:hypothetical protein